MVESKINATERLRCEGRWDEASRYRDEVRRRLKAEGKARAEAAEAAWAAMLNMYPPLSTPEGESANIETSEDEASFDALLQRCGGAGSDLVRDVLWTYENLENRKVRPEEAPSAGAWSLLKWARDNRNRFFEQVLPKAMAARAKQEDELPQEELDPGIADLERMLERLHENWEAALIADTPATVKRDVRSNLADWQRRWEVELPVDAQRSLESQFIELVDRCIGCVLRDPTSFRRPSQNSATAAVKATQRETNQASPRLY